MERIVLSDKDLLHSLRANQMRGVELEGVFYEKGAGERPLDFLDRVRNQYSAWKAMQADTVPSKKRRPSDDVGGGLEVGQPRKDSASSQPDVQATEASLADTLQSKVTTLGRLVEVWKGKRAKAYSQFEFAVHELKRYERELEQAQRFLKEVTDDARPVSTEVGDNLLGQEGEGGVGERGGVGDTDRATSGVPGSAGEDSNSDEA